MSYNTNFSAAQLVKLSAAHQLYLKLNNEKLPVTINQIIGNEHANAIADEQQASKEKRGFISTNRYTINFCIDMVVEKDNAFCEIKHVRDMNTYESWYLNMSIMQATLYASLLKTVKFLDTPVFMLRKGYKQEIISVPSDHEYFLYFGESKYQVYSDDAILKHYKKKAKIIAKGIDERSYDDCKKFDAKFKHKEFDIFKPQYKKL